MGNYNSFADVEIDIVGISKDVKSLEKRMDEQDELDKQLRELITSVQLLAQNMEQMLAKQDEQKAQLDKQNKEIEEIKMRPANNWNTMQRTIFTTIIGALAGAMVTYLIQII